MSLIFKSSEKTDSGNIVSLPPETESSKISVSTGDYIVSYTTLETGNTNKKFLTTDIITDDAEETSDVKVLSMSGFNAFEQQIYGIISSSLNNNSATIVYTSADILTENVIYNPIHLGINTINSAYFQEEATITVDTSAIFNVTAKTGSDIKKLKILKTGIYKLNYALYTRLTATTTPGTYAFTPRIHIIRGIDDSGALIHHSSILTNVTEPTYTSTYDPTYPSYIVKDDTEISHAFVGTNEYLFTTNGTVTFSYQGLNFDTPVQEYIGIWIGVNFTPSEIDFKAIDGDAGDKVYFVANIEYIGT